MDEMTWTIERAPDGLRTYTSGAYRIEPVARVSKKLARTGYGQNGEKGYVVSGWTLFHKDRRIQGTRTLQAAKDRARSHC